MVHGIKVEGRVAVVEGVPVLSGAQVECTDLRGGAALVIGALAAEGVYDDFRFCTILIVAMKDWKRTCRRLVL